MSRPPKSTGTFADLTGEGRAFDAPDFGKPGRCGPDDCLGPGGGCPLCDETCVDRPHKHWHTKPGPNGPRTFVPSARSLELNPPPRPNDQLFDDDAETLPLDWPTARPA
jgi:hypothetical protein